MKRGKRCVDVRQQPGADIFDDAVDVDPARHVVDEEDQHRDRAQRQDHADEQRDVGDEADAAAGLVGRADRAQHQQAVEVGGDERAERDLIAAVAHEVAEQARPVLARGVDDGGDRDREDGAGDGDHRPADRRQHQPRAAGMRRVEPRHAVQPRRAGPGVPGDHGAGQQHGQQRHQGREEPVAVAQAVGQTAADRAFTTGATRRAAPRPRRGGRRWPGRHRLRRPAPPRRGRRRRWRAWP